MKKRLIALLLFFSMILTMTGYAYSGEGEVKAAQETVGIVSESEETIGKQESLDNIENSDETDDEVSDIEQEESSKENETLDNSIESEELDSSEDVETSEEVEIPGEVETPKEPETLEEAMSPVEELQVEEEKSIPTLMVQTHVQDYGWKSWESARGVFGTTGESKRLEAIKIKLEYPDEVLDENKYEGNVEYRVHVEDYGWLTWTKEGNAAGTEGEKKRIEAIEIRLTGELAETFSVYYRLHVADFGWLAWTKDGGRAGTEAMSKRAEALEISLERKDESVIDTTGRSYVKGLTNDDVVHSVHVQDYGNLKESTINTTLGTIGKSKRMESVRLAIKGGDANTIQGGIEYRTHVQNIGWQDWKANNQMAGTTGKKLRIEAIQIKLSGEIAKHYDIYYRAHVQNLGWLGWAKNGQSAGTSKMSYRMESLQIRLVAKRGTPPGSNSNYYTERERYQNPANYYQIKTSISLSGGGYTLSYGFEGVKVMKVIQKLGLGNGVGMNGAFYSKTVENAVKEFQKKCGLSQTGKVDLLTWLRLGFNEKEWELWGAYVSPLKTNEFSTRSEHIEAMISTAYSYLGTPYVIGASGPPGTGIDCSGLVMQGLYAAGLDVSPINPVRHAHPGYEYESRNMWASPKFKHVSYSQRQRGDLIFYQNAKGVVIHVAIYLGNDQVIESWPNEVVVWPIKNKSRSNIKGVVRPFV